MKKTGLGLVGMAFLLAACGGEDTVSINDIDSGTDSGGGNDTGVTTDTGTGSDTGTTTDGSVGTDGSTTTDAGTFQVGKVPGLVLWLNAGKGVNAGSVDAWLDQTTFKNDAKQAIQARRPTMVANQLNGQPVVHFDKGNQNGPGQMLVIADSASMQWGTGDFYVVVVGRFDNNVGDGNARGVGLLFSKVSNAPNFPGPALYGNVPSLSNVTVGLDFATNVQAGNFVVTSTAYNNNAAHAFAMQRVGAKLDLRVDSASVGTSTSTNVDVSNAGTIARIGADGDASTFRLNGDVAEVIAVKGALTSQEQAGIQAYLKAKYALP